MPAFKPPGLKLVLPDVALDGVTDAAAGAADDIAELEAAAAVVLGLATTATVGELLGAWYETGILKGMFPGTLDSLMLALLMATREALGLFKELVASAV